jgi:hypothetical protein
MQSTLVQLINLQFVVLCLDCMRVSRTRDPTLDMSVTISFSKGGVQNQSLKKMINNGSNKAIKSSKGTPSNSIEIKDKNQNNSFFRRVLRMTFCKCTTRVKNKETEED